MDVLDELAAAVVPEGVESVVPHKGPLADVVYQLVGGLRSGMSYSNAATLPELRRNARFIRQTEAAEGADGSERHRTAVELERSSGAGHRRRHPTSWIGPA